MTTNTKQNELFERTIDYPDTDAQERLSRLVGLDEHKSTLTKLLGLLVNSQGLTEWAEKYHPDSKVIINTILRRTPLVVLAGDVGSGKTELAETIADSVARQEGIDITLIPLSLSARGQGRVGEMTQLISSAFDFTIEQASKLKSSGKSARGAIILLVDEADAIAQSRESAQMHHEDRAGVNAFIRGVDQIGTKQLPAAVIMCTNRLNALDPAIKRRAADILTFERPNKEQRNAVLVQPLKELGFTYKQIDEIVIATGSQNGCEYGFTFSDLVQRLIPKIVLDAYPDKPVAPKRALEIVKMMNPTPPFKEGEE